VKIMASRENIWEAIISEEDFVDWCSAFCEGSYFEGDWSVGSRMKFLGPSPEDGREGGMISEVVEHKSGHVLRLRAAGVIEDGQERFEGDDVDPWKGNREEYVLVGESDPFELQIYAEAPQSMYDFFDSAWEKAVTRIKELAEQK
jgi:hypothetical protein